MIADKVFKSNFTTDNQWLPYILMHMEFGILDGDRVCLIEENA